MKIQGSAICVLLALCIAGVTTLHAQFPSSADLRPSAASYYLVAKPGELTMQVNIWGYVTNPGRYEVATSTDLVQLLSYAGGPAKDGVIDEVRISRVVRTDNGSTRWELTVDLEDLSEIDPTKLVLYPGDTIVVDHSSWLTIRDAFTVITTAAIITAAVAAVVSANARAQR